MKIKKDFINMPVSDVVLHYSLTALRRLAGRYATHVVTLYKTVTKHTI